MKSNSLLRNAVRLALTSGFAAAFVSPAVVAQDQQEGDEEARELDRVQVTGSRITRTQIEGATPVTTIDREDIEATGFQSVADVLRNNSFNSFGSIREESGNTAQSQATLSLRGLGSNRTLILLNGRRMPGSPVLDGSAQNLNTIPFSAVERIEILSDGASAVYGSDAIGGVVNIILRSDYEGAEITVREQISDREGGDESLVSVVGGMSGPRGNMTFTLEKDQKDVIFTRDRHWLASEDMNPSGQNDYFNTTGYSLYSRNIADASAGGVLRSMAQEDCSVYGDGHNATIYDYFGMDVCTFDHTQSSATTADLDRTNLFFDSNYHINDDVTMFARATHSRVESFGRYAPAAGFFIWDGPVLPETDYGGQYGGQSFNELGPGDSVYYRFDNTASSRDTIQNNYMTDIQFGFEGYTGPFSWDVGYQYNIYDMKEWGTGYVNVLGLNAAADAGWDPRDPDQSQYSDLVADMRSNANRDSQMKFSRLDMGTQFDLAELPAGVMSMYVGGEYRTEEYYDTTQAQMVPGNVIGTAGGSSSGERDVSAVFAEMNMPLTDTLEMDLAVRYDDYSDFGSNTSGKLSARWQPSQSFVMRGSFGQGFRAPTLDQLHQAPAQSFAFADDIPTCMGAAGYDDNGDGLGTISEVDLNNPAAAADLSDCISNPNAQHETDFVNNPELGAEKSNQYSVGAVYDFSEMLGQDLSVSLDYYYIEIEDQLISMGAQDVMWLAFLEQAGNYQGIEYNDPGAGNPHVAGPTNFESFDTSGIDINVQYSADMGGFGRFGADFTLSHVLEYNSRFTPISDPQDYTELTLNEYRADATLDWRLGDHSVSWHTYYIPGQCTSTQLDSNSIADLSLQAECTTAPDGSKREIGGWAHHNMSYNYDTAWDGTITLGINNVNDADPQIDHNNASDTGLYPMVGRQYVVQYRQRF